MAGKLTVPANITLRKEVWKGVGIKETIITGIVTAVTAAVGFIYVKFFNENGVMLSVFLTMFLCAASITVQTRIENNLSIVDYIRIWKRYKRQQQVFKYVKKEEVLHYVEKS